MFWQKLSTNFCDLQWWFFALLKIMACNLFANFTNQTYAPRASSGLAKYRSNLIFLNVCEWFFKYCVFIIKQLFFGIPFVHVSTHKAVPQTFKNEITNSLQNVALCMGNFKKKKKVLCWIWTQALWVRSPLLYQLSYWVSCMWEWNLTYMFFLGSRLKNYSKSRELVNML